MWRLSCDACLFQLNILDQAKSVPPIPAGFTPTQAAHLVACIRHKQPLAVVLVHKGVVPGVACKNNTTGGVQSLQLMITVIANVVAASAGLGLRAAGLKNHADLCCTTPEARRTAASPTRHALCPRSPNSAGMKALPTASSGATASTLNPARFFTLRLSMARAICVHMGTGQQREADESV